ncbi:hypothetical protein [Methyloversatilis discipulorum]|uniref:hypothetical protein n=1 Tax=Methyloversatilis discipulorum TaxID=1119528 RepID=UPI001A569CB5|nr:hypothetical protein [Methyloversatilis discipulorum]MBL8466281.1 hypothetical protein [Methyloversatilis discipulorum]
MLRIALSLFALLWASISFSAEVSSSAVLKYAEVHGGRAALEKYFSCEGTGFNGYLKVASGSKQWLDVAVRLLASSDACYSEGLHDAVAKALYASPSTVLPLVDSSSMLKASQICLPFLSDEEPHKQHLAYLKRLEERLSRVTDRASQSGKAKCIGEIHAMRKML